MPALSFSARFADAVQSGQKRQTIRASNRAMVGDRLFLYTGMRTKACRKLGEAVCCEVYQINLLATGIEVKTDSQSAAFGVSSGWSADQKAINDGFKDWPEMRDWFSSTHGLPFAGWLIQWGAIDNSAATRTRRGKK